jgi:DNA-binding MarR family transcriptional regulator
MASRFRGFRSAGVLLMIVEDRLIFLISKVYQKLILNLQKAFSDAQLEVTPIQAMVLFLLQKKDGASLTELSHALMLENPTVTGLTDRLEKLGYVKRADHPEDRRVYLIHLTEKGKKVATKALPIVKELNEEIKKGYSKEEIENFKKVLVGAFNKF